MIRFIAVAFALAVATSAQAMSPAPLHQADDMITQVRQALWRRDEAGITHSVAVRLHPPAVMSAAEWSQATKKPKNKKPDHALALSGFQFSLPSGETRLEVAAHDLSKSPTGHIRSQDACSDGPSVRRRLAYAEARFGQRH